MAAKPCEPERITSGRSAIRADLIALPGVTDVHDLHIRTLTSEMEVASAHLKVREDADTRRVLTMAAQLMRERHRVGHATLQVEPTDHKGCGTTSAPAGQRQRASISDLSTSDS